MTAIQFEIPGVPVAKGRPKFARRGAFVTAYTPEKTVRYESTVALFGKQAMGGLPPITSAVECRIDAYMPIPASWSQKRRQAARDGSVLPASRPDIENVTKAVLDGLNGITWADDSLVVDLTARKRYSDVPRLLVWIRAL